MPPQLETFGLVKTLDSVTKQINDTGNIAITLNAASDLDIAQWEINLNMYRIIMELIANTLKHAGATIVNIEIYLSGSDIVCRYADNGKGLGGNHTQNGLGHKSIEARVKAHNGSFDIGQPATGFLAHIRIPADLVAQTRG